MRRGRHLLDWGEGGGGGGLQKEKIPKVKVSRKVNPTDNQIMKYIFYTVAPLHVCSDQSVKFRQFALTSYQTLRRRGIPKSSRENLPDLCIYCSFFLY